MKPGNMVNYTGRPFDGPRFGGLVLQSKVHLDVDDPRAKENVNTHQVYWGSHNITNWVLEKNLEVTS